jgi:hypothetical protein
MRGWRWEAKVSGTVAPRIGRRWGPNQALEPALGLNPLLYCTAPYEDVRLRGQ